MSETRIRVGGTSRLGKKSSGGDGLALPAPPEDRPRWEADQRVRAGRLAPGRRVGGTASAPRSEPVVTSDSSGSSGPDVINGDGDQTGFSVVETGTSQFQIHVGKSTYPLSGYASP